MCEQIIQDKQTGEEYLIYFAQGKLYKNDKVVPEGYDEQLYVVSENLYPIKLLEWEGYNAYAGISWDVDEKLQIIYEDDSRKEYILEELIEEEK